MLKIEYFKYVVEISKCRSISRAAEKLFISQPYLSAELKKLEGALRAELFVRSRNGMSLTEAGEHFLSIARQICALEEEASALGRPPVQTPSALSVSSIYSFTMLELFRRFSRSHTEEQMDYTYEEMPNVDIPARVRDGGTDVGLIYLCSTTEEQALADFHASGLTFHPLCRECLYLVVGAVHPLAERESVTFDDLLAYPLVVEKIKSRKKEASFEENLLFPELFVRNIRMPMLFDNSRSLMFYLSRADNCFWVGQRSLNLENPFYLRGELRYIPIRDAHVTLTTGYLTARVPEPGSTMKEFLTLLEMYFAQC